MCREKEPTPIFSFDGIISVCIFCVVILYKLLVPSISPYYNKPLKDFFETWVTCLCKAKIKKVNKKKAKRAAGIEGQVATMLDT